VTNTEGFLMIAVLVLLFYAMAVCVWTPVLLKRWLGSRSLPPATIDNLVLGWPAYLPSAFVWLVRRTRDTLTAQRLRVVVALAAAVAVVCLLLFAPWVVGSGPGLRPCGRASVFGRGPAEKTDSGRHLTPYYLGQRVASAPQHYGRIATGELAVEVGAVLGVAGLLLLVIPKPR